MRFCFYFKPSLKYWGLACIYVITGISSILTACFLMPQHVDCWRFTKTSRFRRRNKFALLRGAASIFGSGSDGADKEDAEARIISLKLMIYVKTMKGNIPILRTGKCWGQVGAISFPGLQYCGWIAESAAEKAVRFTTLRSSATLLSRSPT